MKQEVKLKNNIKVEVANDLFLQLKTLAHLWMRDWDVTYYKSYRSVHYTR